jgi:hypothetical protein
MEVKIFKMDVYIWPILRRATAAHINTPSAVASISCAVGASETISLEMLPLIAQANLLVTDRACLGSEPNGYAASAEARRLRKLTDAL